MKSVNLPAQLQVKFCAFLRSSGFGGWEADRKLEKRCQSHRRDYPELKSGIATGIFRQGIILGGPNGNLAQRGSASYETRHLGKITFVPNELGISRQTLYELMEKLSISRE